MPRRTKSSDDLLGERDQFEAWLARLDENQDLASDKVRSKVRDDYQHRLSEVLEELSSHGDSIRDQLAEHREKESDLTAQESVAREELSEAEVRHAVGEYDDDEWKKLKDMSDEQLERLDKELTEVKGEIERLASVQALISAQPGPAAVDDDADGDDAPDLDQAPGDTAPADETPAHGAPKFTPRGAEPGGTTGAPKTLQFPGERSGGSGLDELDFLKSVSEDEQAGPSSAAAGKREASKVAAAADAAPAGDNAAPQSKTLKCGECGELNRPTEWYCERCGAELASL